MSIVIESAHPRRWWILGALSLSLLVIGLDLTVLSVALPTLVRELDASTQQLQWIMDAYTLVMAAALLPAGTFGDLYGRKRVLTVGLAIFLVGSMLCAYAWSANSLVAFRALMGFGAAMVTPLTLSVIPTIFPEAERPRAIATWSIVLGLSIALGPIVGGWLLDHYWWGSIFLVNVPFIVGALAAVIVMVPESRDVRSRGFDPGGGLLAMAGLTLLVYSIIQQPVRGWDWATLSALAGGAVLLIVYAIWEMRVKSPMLDIRLFSNPRFTWAVVAFGCVGLVQMGSIFLFTQYLQDVLGYRPFDVGLRVIPLVVGLIFGSQLSSFMLSRLGTKLEMAIGYGVLALSLGFLATTSSSTTYTTIAVGFFFIGFGLGSAMTPGIDAVLGALPSGEFGAGSAVSNTFRMVGGSIGIALLGNVYINRYLADLTLPPVLPSSAVAAIRQSVGAANVVAGHLPRPLDSLVRTAAHSAFISGMDQALVVAALVALFAGIMVLAFLPARKAHAERRTIVTVA